MPGLNFSRPLADWPEWFTARENVEAAAGISLAKNQYVYRAATFEAKGGVPGMLIEILAKVKGK